MPLTERSPDRLDLEHSKRDIQMVRGLARAGLLSPDRMAAIADRLERVATNGKQERMRVAADKALAGMQVALLRLLKDQLDKPNEANVTNQQINIYLPANGREV